MNLASRRHFLRSASGVCLSLPLLPSLSRGSAKAADAALAAASPKRLAYLYVPNGVNTSLWDVKGTGRDYELSPTLQPLAPFRDQFSVLSGLDQKPGDWAQDGPGDHARATATFLTGTRARKTASPDIHLGISADQVAAREIGHATRLPSLELSTDVARSSGKCDSGYNCAYQFNLSWRSPNQPVPAEQNPRAVFDRLFGSSGAVNQSVLDFVLEDARDLQRRVSANDRERLEQYFEAIRGVEQRIQKAESSDAEVASSFDVPKGIPASYEGHIQAMFDLMVLAFQTDTTRIATFMLAHDGSNRSFPEIGVPQAHHQLSHHQRNEKKLEQIAKIDAFYVRQFYSFLERMAAVREGEETLLDRSMVVYGSGLKDGDRHSHHDLPLILAGRGGGALEPGRHIVAPKGTPMMNLHLRLVHEMGGTAPRIGDSTEALKSV